MNASGIHIQGVTKSRRPPTQELGAVAFSSVFSDHMLTAEYCDGAWQPATIGPYGPLSLMPSVSSLQYAISVFEGLKAHRLPNGKVALFRPLENARRLNRSAARLAMPVLPEECFLGGLRELLRLDHEWVPPAGEGALYIRPCLFSIDPSVRVKAAERYLFVIFTFPFGVYYAEPVKAQATARYVRAFPGGTGDVKPAGNYAPAILAEGEARSAGYHTVLWLDGVHRRYIEECGVMNVFFVIGDTVVTPALEGTILPGITRDSAIRVMRDLGLTVNERRIGVDEVITAYEGKTLRECFGTGTAATLSHIVRIGIADRVLELPPVSDRPIGSAVRDKLVAIATGRAPDDHGWLQMIDDPGEA